MAQHTEVVLPWAKSVSSRQNSKPYVIDFTPRRTIRTLIWRTSPKRAGDLKSQVAATRGQLMRTPSTVRSMLEHEETREVNYSAHIGVGVLDASLVRESFH